MLEEARKNMEGSIAHLKAQLAKLHTGRANPGLVEELQVEAYDQRMRLMEVASITVPQPNMLLVTPWDKSIIANVVHALETANIGINPQSDGDVIRLAIPPLSEERRKELIKLMHGDLEESRVAIRQHRHEEREAIQEAKKSGKISEDEAQRQEKELQKLTDEMIENIEEIGRTKEKELLEV